MNGPYVFEGKVERDFLDDGGEALGCDVWDGEERDHGMWVQLRSNLGQEFMKENGRGYQSDHAELSQLIGKKVRVTVEVID